MINLQNCTVKQFLQMTEHKPIVCFCAGEKLLEFCDRFHMEKQILYAADNFKHGQVLKIGDAELPVISMEQLDESCRDAVCVLTSMRHAREIVQQLDAIPVCNDIEVYAYELLQDESGEIEWEKNVPAVIPKKFTTAGLEMRLCQNIFGIISDPGKNIVLIMKSLSGMKTITTYQKIHICGRHMRKRRGDLCRIMPDWI